VDLRRRDDRDILDTGQQGSVIDHSSMDDADADFSKYSCWFLERLTTILCLCCAARLEESEQTYMDCSRLIMLPRLRERTETDVRQIAAAVIEQLTSHRRLRLQFYTTWIF